ncbi:dTDP-4-amino-4,6-dideoxygalactose transaminase [Arenicella sp. 4NH20-0111]|uniref:dTDP-4-amino-4,6-dideoxygalactose transaminase n=1 Tax=Arenicella sp. 4NH20-0111 TaxID=3127648 RepID=UPI003105A697
MQKNIPFNKPYMTGKELFYISQAHFNGCLAGDGPFTKKSHLWLEESISCKKALLTHSCTAALEMSALLLDLSEGDEVIMPSYTFVSTANAFVLRGAKPVFVDIREDTLNIDENLIAEAITSKTKAIVPVHYAGVSCEMDTIMELANLNGLSVVEDAAQGIGASYKGRPLGSIGSMGTLSFHETKNVISGEGGALLVNDENLIESAEIIREKGTDRSRFMQGLVDKYTWRSEGSSFLPGELTAAFLFAQLIEERTITSKRLSMWEFYHENIKCYEDSGFLRRPYVPLGCEHNAHMYYILLDSSKMRDKVLAFMTEQGIGVVFHYVPLHSSPAGEAFGASSGALDKTNDLSSRLLRLPLWIGLSEEDQRRVIEVLGEALTSAHK